MQDPHYKTCPYCGASGYKLQVAMQALTLIENQDLENQSGMLLKVRAAQALHEIASVDWENTRRREP